MERRRLVRSQKARARLGWASLGRLLQNIPGLSLLIGPLCESSSVQTLSARGHETHPQMHCGVFPSPELCLEANRMQGKRT